MEAHTKLVRLDLEESEIDRLCIDLSLCSEEPSEVGVQILKLNGLVWKEPVVEVEEAVPTDSTENINY